MARADGNRCIDLQVLLEQYLLYENIENVSELDDCLRVVSAQQLYKILTTIRDPKRGRRTVIHLAAGRNHVDILKRLLEPLDSLQKFEILKVKHINNGSLLHCAAGSGCDAIVKLALSSRSEDEVFELLSIQTIQGFTALHHAVYYSRTSTMKCMLEALSCDKVYELLQIKGTGGITALYDAIQRRHNDSIQCILNAVTPELRYNLLSLEAGPRNDTALHISAWNGHTDTLACVFDLIPQEYHFKLIMKPSCKGHALAHYVMNKGQTETVRYLITTAREDNYLYSLLEKQDYYGTTPLHHTVVHIRIHAIKLALDSSSLTEIQQLLDIKDNEGHTPEEAASIRGYKEMAELLHRYSSGGETSQGHVVGEEGSQELTEAAVVERDRQLEIENQNTTGERQPKQRLQGESKVKVEVREEMDKQIKEPTSSSREKNQQIADHRRQTKKRKEKCGEQDDNGWEEAKKLKLLDQLAQRQDQADQQLATLGERQVALSGRVDGHDRRITNAEIINQSTQEELTDVSHRVENLEDNTLPIGGHEQPADELFQAVEEGADVVEDNQ